MDGEGVIIKEVVCWKPTTESKLIEVVSDGFLDSFRVVNDVEAGLNWPDFKASFNVGV